MSDITAENIAMHNAFEARRIAEEARCAVEGLANQRDYNRRLADHLKAVVDENNAKITAQAERLELYEGRVVGDGPVKSVEAGLVSELTARVELQAAEIKRLRAALDDIAKDDHVQKWKTKPGIIARAALQEDKTDG